MTHCGNDKAGLMILVVDNDPLIRLGTVFMVREMGFAVESANGADEAIAKIDEGFVPDLLITDYAMPGGNGIELAHRALVINPDLCVLIVSGHGQLQAHAKPGWGLLGKPFTGGELLEAIKETIQADATHPSIPSRQNPTQSGADVR